MKHFQMVVDTLFLCVCEDRAINGPNGRYKESKLAHLLGEEPTEQTDGQIEGQIVEETIRQVEMAPINRQPFSQRQVEMTTVVPRQPFSLHD